MVFSIRQILAAGLFALGALPAFAAELVMVEQPGCVYCAEWDSKLAPIYPKTTEGAFAPLRRVQKTAIASSGIQFDRPVLYTPTFVLIEGNTELGRIEGYPGEDFFWGMLGLMLSAKTDYVPTAHPNG